MRVVIHYRAVLKSARLSLISVTAEELIDGRVFRDKAPLKPRGETGSASPRSPESLTIWIRSSGAYLEPSLEPRIRRPQYRSRSYENRPYQYFLAVSFPSAYFSLLKYCIYLTLGKVFVIVVVYLHHRSGAAGAEALDRRQSIFIIHSGLSDLYVKRTSQDAL